MSSHDQPEDRITRSRRALTDALESGALQPLRKVFNALHPAEIAHLLESLPHSQRVIVWEIVADENRGDVLAELNDEVRAGLIIDMETSALVALTEDMDTDDLVDILQDLPNTVNQRILQSMSMQDRHRVEDALSYPEDSAGGLMNTDTVTVRADATLDVVLRYLRLRGELPELTDSLIVVDRNDRYVGILPLSLLLTNDPNLSVAEIMTLDTQPLPVDMPASEVARIFEKRDLVSAPVVDSQQRLLGRITIDDVVDVIRDEAEHSVLSMAGLDEEDDLFAPVGISARRRALWLGVNLFTAFTAAGVIGLFEATLDQIVVLAVLMPIVASMGGIAGSQTLILMIRGFALGQASESNARWLLMREIAVSILNGVFWAIVVAAIVIAWFDSLEIGMIIAAALIINLLCAALAGVGIPLLLHRVGIDAALAGNVILTTITDVVGFFAFLGLATIFLL